MMIILIKKLIICLTLIYPIIIAKKPMKLVNGMFVEIKDYPHFAGILWNNHPICSGSIISKKHVITAASCVLFDLISIASNLNVITGTSDIYNEINGITSIHEVSYVIYFKDYSSPTNLWTDDIAILKLTTEIKFSQYQWKLNLPTSYVSTGKRAELTGLAKGIVPIDSIDEHAMAYRYIQMVLAEAQRLDKCPDLFKWHEGDSGAAVVRDNEIVGIASILDPEKTRLIVFTKILPFFEFIENIVENY
ncbi:hypothetical protein HCN44_010191 [Aphidius gifuensis]|uniref:Peptidase S1 domain-containing protein n=1 Tax=Aphidius gifuensis TaxID=684658 RepID=A0A834XVI9_APHGI|nr:hypothetical protein HCN44_010191 [Aphidius gifuensis]